MAEQATLNRLVGGSTPPKVTKMVSSSDGAFLFGVDSEQFSVRQSQAKFRELLATCLLSLGF